MTGPAGDDQKSAGVDSLSPDLKANPDGPYIVWFAPTAPVPRQLAILCGIEAGRPPLFIDSLDLPAQMAEANPGAGFEPEPIMTVGLDLHGYRLPAPPAAAGKAPRARACC